MSRTKKQRKEYEKQRMEMIRKHIESWPEDVKHPTKEQIDDLYDIRPIERPCAGK